jgi:LCP family protein required for cell wall assembly
MDEYGRRGGPPPRRGAPGWGQPRSGPPGRPPGRADQETVLLPQDEPDRGYRPRPVPPDRPRVATRQRSLVGRRRPRWGRRILAVVGVLLLLVVGLAVYVDFSLNRVAALPADSTTTSAGTNWLIVGSDSRQQLTAAEKQKYATGDETSQLTDTIMLLHSGASGTVLVSIPRDSQVDIPGHGRAKINSAYGKGGGPDGGGPELLVKTVEQATGLHIDHYAEIGFLGIVNVVDAIGGVDLCVPESIKDPKAALDIKAGCQTLDQATALGYVRTRATATSDFGRVERQRAFLSAMLDKIVSPAVLANPFRLVPLATDLSGAITVDSGDHVWNLAQLGLAMRGLGNGISTTVPVRDGVVNWDKDRASALFGALQEDNTPPKSALGP